MPMKYAVAAVIAIAQAEAYNPGRCDIDPSLWEKAGEDQELYAMRQACTDPANSASPEACDAYRKTSGNECGWVDGCYVKYGYWEEASGVNALLDKWLPPLEFVKAGTQVEFYCANGHDNCGGYDCSRNKLMLTCNGDATEDNGLSSYGPTSDPFPEGEWIELAPRPKDLRRILGDGGLDGQQLRCKRTEQHTDNGKGPYHGRRLHRSEVNTARQLADVGAGKPLYV